MCITIGYIRNILYITIFKVKHVLLYYVDYLFGKLLDACEIMLLQQQRGKKNILFSFGL